MSEDRRGRRRLSTGERALWKTVTHAVKRLKSAKVDNSPLPEPPAAEAASPPPPPRPLPAAPARKPPPPPPLAPLERRVRQRLARGAETIDHDHRLDLHGLTQRAAHAALVHFLHAAQASGAKIVLVVTGKGARTAERDPFAERGVLRRLVPQWLGHPEFRDLVVGFEPANIGHGGEGALYVRLRRRR